MKVLFPILLVVVLLSGFVAFLWFFQDRLIYLPRSYQDEPEYMEPDTRLVELRYATTTGPQRSFYLPAREGKDSLPETLWIVFGGNASLARDWVSMAEAFPSPHCAFLLIDYPGYGDNPGKPSPASIHESSNAAFAACMKKMEMQGNRRAPELGVVGHSLGAAVGLEFAVQHAVASLVFIAPFTSMMDMAKRRVPWPLPHLLHHHFDNVERLRELLAIIPHASVAIIHGEDDSIIPLSMSLTLKRLFSGNIVLHEITGGDHNHILDEQRELIYQCMIGMVDGRSHG